MTDRDKALIEFPPSAVAAAATFAQRTLADRAQRAVAVRETDPTTTGRVLIVDQLDPAAYPTISEAVAAAETGDRVLVRPGHYRESVVIDKSISVEGDGEREAIVVEAIGDPAFIVTGRMARLVGLTLVAGGMDWDTLFAAGRKYHGAPAALRLSAEDTLVEHLIVRDGDGIDVAEGRPTIRGCLVASLDIGISVQGGACPTIEANEVSGNARFGIYVSDVGSDPLIRGNRVRGELSSGIFVHRGASPTIQYNKVSGSACGIFVLGGASPTIDSNDVYGNADAGIEVSEAGSDPVIRSNTVHDGRRGIFVNRGASPTIDSNEVYGNASSGISVSGTGTDPVIKNNVVRDGRGSGIWVWDGASPTIEANAVYGHARGDIEVSGAGSDIVVGDNKVGR